RELRVPGDGKERGKPAIVHAPGALDQTHRFALLPYRRAWSRRLASDSTRWIDGDGLVHGRSNDEQRTPYLHCPVRFAHALIFQDRAIPAVELFEGCSTPRSITEDRGDIFAPHRLPFLPCCRRLGFPRIGSLV